MASFLAKNLAEKRQNHRVTESPGGPGNPESPDGPEGPEGPGSPGALKRQGKHGVLGKTTYEGDMRVKENQSLLTSMIHEVHVLRTKSILR